MRFSGGPTTSKWLVLLAILFVFSGCTQTKAFFKTDSDSAKAKSAKNKAEKKSYYVHKVRWEGETLSLIAKWYTGSQKNWKVLAKDNPWLEPNDISTGHKIFIPRNLLKTKKPMPHDYVLASKPGYKVGKTGATQAGKAGDGLSESKADELELVVP